MPSKNTHPMSASRCQNCGHGLDNTYCAACGQRIRERITLARMARFVVSALFDSESGFPATVIGLFRHPGRVVRNYIDGATVRYTNPARYLVIIVAVVQLFVVLSGGADSIAAGMADASNAGDASANMERDAAQQILEDYLFVVLLLGVPVIACLQRLFFAASRLNFAEQLVFSSYIYAQQLLIMAIPLAADQIAPSIPDSITAPVLVIAPIAYYVWALVVFTRAPIVSGVLRALAVSLLGLLSSGMVVAFTLGVLRGLQQ